MVGTTALLCLAVLLPGPRAPLWRAVPVRTRRSVVVGTADSALAAAKPPALPTREEIEQMDTLVELHARLALHGADFPGRRKAPLRNRLLELLEEEEAAERRRFAEEEEQIDAAFDKSFEELLAEMKGCATEPLAELS